MYYDPKRKGFNLGTCRKLKGSVYTLIIYLDDNVSWWSHSEISHGCAPKIGTALKYLELKAREWNSSLCFRTGNYYTDSSDNTFVRYKGCVETDIMNKYPSYDILGQAASSLGFSSIDEFHKFIKNYSGEEQVMYLILLNKEGRSYAMSDKINDGNDYVEYCVLFAKDSDGSYGSLSSSVAHETLHLFGAEDYYDPYNKYPVRKIMAQKLYPDDIMMQTYRNVYNNKVGGFTAYSVGWLDKIPKECDREEWWK